MAYCILHNPLAGNGTSKDRLDKLLQFLGNSAKVFDMTKMDGYSDFLSEVNEDDVIVLVGGDGTLNRFVNDTEPLNIKNEILYYPAGTGNDFIKDVGEGEDKPISVNKYIKDLPTVEVKGKKYRFINGIGYGIDGYCCEVGDDLKSKSDKPVNYTAIAIKGLLFNYRPTNATVTVDGQKHTYKKVWLAPTMNGRYYGGGMMPTPSQDRLNESGKVTVMVWHGCGKLRTLMAFPSIFKGEHLKKKKMIETYTAHEISVEFDRPVALQIDGETVLGVSGYKVTSSVRKPVAV